MKCGLSGRIGDVASAKLMLSFCQSTIVIEIPGTAELNDDRHIVGVELYLCFDGT